MIWPWHMWQLFHTLELKRDLFSSTKAIISLIRITKCRFYLAFDLQWQAIYICFDAKNLSGATHEMKLRHLSSAIYCLCPAEAWISPGNWKLTVPHSVASIAANRIRLEKESAEEKAGRGKLSSGKQSREKSLKHSHRHGSTLDHDLRC